jgi:hypothetical protein
MSKWRVLLNGMDFWLHFDGKPSRMGFFTTRIVEAPDAVSAELAAVEMLRREVALRAPVNSAEDPPMIRAEEILEVIDVARERASGACSVLD